MAPVGLLLQGGKELGIEKKDICHLYVNRFSFTGKENQLRTGL